MRSTSGRCTSTPTSLDPVDDVMQRLIAKYGKLGRAYEYLAFIDKHWMAVPVGWGSAPLPPVARLSMWQKFAGIDVKKWFPDQPSTPDASKEWTYAKQLEVAELFHKAGYPVGFGCRAGDSTDANQTWGATFGAFGADLVNAKGEITVESDNVMAVMEYMPEAHQVHAARCAAVGRRLEQPRADLRQGRLYLEPAVGLGGGEARRAGGCGRLLALLATRSGRRAAWCRIGRISGASGSSGRTRRAAKELIEYLSQREQVEQLAAPVAGYDIPPFTSMYDMKIWSEVEPPKGTDLQLSGPRRGTTRSTTSPVRRRLRRSRSRFGTAASRRRWSPA